MSAAVKLGPVAYQHMAAEAARVGWPLRFPGDLHEHDRGFLARLPPGAPVVWHLGSGCTQIHAVDRASMASLTTWVRAVRECYPDCRIYTWDGAQLRETTDADALEWAREVAR